MTAKEQLLQEIETASDETIDQLLNFLHQTQATKTKQPFWQFIEELTAEKQILRFKNGYPQRVWVKKSNARNEALDELVYAYSALHRLYQLYDRRTIWDQLERKLRALPDDPTTEPKTRNHTAFNVLSR
jgi:phage terminase large subunit GpA-like protein